MLKAQKRKKENISVSMLIYFMICQSNAILLACCNGGIGGGFNAHCPSDGFRSQSCKPKYETFRITPLKSEYDRGENEHN